MASDEQRATTMIKFMCSHGGTILPRLGDGKLKYVGGETRKIAVPPNINFSELLKKLGAMVEGERILKYQANSEDLDALVTVRSEEDLKLMLDDFRAPGPPTRRVFLFPTNPSVLDNLTNLTDPLALQLRYIEAINGISRSRPSFTISTCNSPPSISVETRTFDPTNASNPQPLPIRSMQRVQSSPSLNNIHVPQITNGIISNQNAYATSNVHFYQNHHHIPNNIPHPQASPKPPVQDYYVERASSPAASTSIGCHDLVRIPAGVTGGSHFYAAGRYRSSN